MVFNDTSIWFLELINRTDVIVIKLSLSFSESGLNGVLVKKRVDVFWEQILKTQVLILIKREYFWNAFVSLKVVDDVQLVVAVINHQFDRFIISFLVPLSILFQVDSLHESKLRVINNKKQHRRLVDECLQPLNRELVGKVMDVKDLLLFLKLLLRCKCLTISDWWDHLFRINKRPQIKHSQIDIDPEDLKCLHSKSFENELSDRILIIQLLILDVVCLSVEDDC
jgi:hypothetical protein